MNDNTAPGGGADVKKNFYKRRKNLTRQGKAVIIRKGIRRKRPHPLRRNQYVSSGETPVTLSQCGNDTQKLENFVENTNTHSFPTKFPTFPHFAPGYSFPPGPPFGWSEEEILLTENKREWKK